MTAPTPPEGKFVTSDEVVARFEGAFPEDRVTWLKWRIFDVENQLMGQVKSLRKPIDQINADSVAVGDPDRLSRVEALVADKVLDIYRNPDPRMSQMSQTMEQDTVSRSYVRSAGGTAISFTDAELAGVKLRRKRSRIGTLTVAPWRPPCF
jgi:hypothetical protein